MLLCVHVTRVLFLVLAGKFCPDYGLLLLELHTLTLVARSYALLIEPNNCLEMREYPTTTLLLYVLKFSLQINIYGGHILCVSLQS